MLRRRTTAIALLVLIPLLLTACKRRDISTVTRPYDAVVLSGSAVPQLQGIAPSRLVAFTFVSGSWQQVPVQVDERAVLDLAKPKNVSPIGKTALFYTDANTWTGADANATLDADDEIAFMVRDGHGQARDMDGTGSYVLSPPAHTVAGKSIEIEVNDSRKANSAAWVYLFEHDGTLDPAAGTPNIEYAYSLNAGSYKANYNINTGPNPENSRVTTSRYSLHFSDRWITDELEITADGATGVDILDRQKSGFAGSCGRSETTFSMGAGAIIANKTGPVRAIRSVLGANSGTYTQRDHLMYESRADVVTYLRVHAIPPLRDWMDYAPAAAGMTFRTDVSPAGVTIDGVPDAIPLDPVAYQLVSGAQGAIAHTSILDTNITFAPGSIDTFYRDTLTPPEAQCGGDTAEYGASGTTLDMAVPCTDPAQNCTQFLTTTRRMTFLGPGADNTAAATLAAETAAPLTTVVKPFTP